MKNFSPGRNFLMCSRRESSAEPCFYCITVISDGIMYNMIMKNGIAVLVVLVLAISVGVLNIKKTVNITSKAASVCSGSWTCSKGASSYTYQCRNFNGMSEISCTGGGNGQGNYCNTAGGWIRTDGCSWSDTVSKPTPTSVPSPTPTPSSIPIKKLSTPDVHCQSFSVPRRGGGRRRWMQWWWYRIADADYYEVLTDIDPDRFYNKVSQSANPGISLEVARKGTYKARVRALGAGYQPSNYSPSSCSVP